LGLSRLSSSLSYIWGINMTTIIPSSSLHDINSMPPLGTCTVAVVGLGYVGLPLALAFATPGLCARTGSPLKRRVIGFDINNQRLEELRRGHDRTRETSSELFQSAKMLEFTADPFQLADADVFVVTVPTPIDSSRRPDLTPLKKSSATVGQALKLRAERQNGNSQANIKPLVIYESTVYPGATEEVCIPILERISGLTFNEDFYCGYSPERINPGDSNHRLATITKVTSGSTSEASDWVDAFYASIIPAGTHQASSIKVAEAAKVIENTQRDLNIALVNEFAIIFREMGIDTLDILEAAATKWNFLPFRPGLVGGHCIGVDPYYLTHKAEQLGYHPQVVLAGRRINDGMGKWVVEQLVLEMARSGQVIAGASVLVLGLSFKENCPDLRNTRVVDVIREMQRYGINSVVVDPCINIEEAKQEYGLLVSHEIPSDNSYDGIVVAVAHKQFAAMSIDKWSSLANKNGIFLDLKGVVPRNLNPIRI